MIVNYYESVQLVTRLKAELEEKLKTELPYAAAAVLKISDGAVVDVGGGTTGISILKDGKVIYTDDEATGGSHMTMTVAGHYNIPYEEAEILKTDRSKEAEIFPVIKATVENAPMIQSLPILAPSRTTAPIPINVRSPIIHP